MTNAPSMPQAGDTAVPALDDDQVAAYLARIGIDEPVQPSVAWLERVHRAHVLTVPFENLDIHLGRPIRLDLDAFFDKVVTQRRGGFCYELNGLFASLLAALGFDVTLASSRVWLPGGVLSPPVDHATLLVELEGTRLVDVGFGETFLVPHRLGEEWEDPIARCRTVAISDGWRFEADEGEGWVGVYDIDPTPRRLDEFAPRCEYHQTSPESLFVAMPFLSQGKPNGRTTFFGDDRIVRIDGTRDKQNVEELGGLVEAARGHFDPPILELLEQLETVER